MAHRNMDPSAKLAEEYSAKASANARLWSPVIRPMALPLLPALPLRTAARVLDIGSGTGALIADLREAAPAAIVIGVDRAHGMLRIAHHEGHQFLVETDAQTLGVQSASIDVVAMIFVLF